MWRLEMLGGLQLTCPEGQVTHFRLQKVGLLLACLALQRRAPQTREVLCALLWPDAELEAARHNLRQALSSLRAIVGELIVTEGYQSIGLAPHGLVTAATTARSRRTAAWTDTGYVPCHVS